MTRLGSAAARLAPTRRLYLERIDGVEQAVAGRGRRYWLVSRGLCRFFRVPLAPNSSRTRQLEAMALEVKRLSPFDETGSHFHLGGGFASLWLWDQRATNAAAAAVGVDISRVRVLPEPALLPPAESGVRLVETLDGFDAQCWGDGGMTASRWWPRSPDPREWMLFQRGASVAPGGIDPLPPAPQRLTWLERPWPRTRSTGTVDLSRVDLRLVAAGIAAAFVVAYAFQAAAYLHMRSNLGALATEIATRESAIEPVLAARTTALDNLSAIRALHDLDRFPGQIALMARVAEALPPGQSRLDDWVYDRGQLELSIASEQPLDVVSLVRALESSRYFSGVAAERAATNNTLRLHASVEAR